MSDRLRCSLHTLLMKLVGEKPCMQPMLGAKRSDVLISVKPDGCESAAVTLKQ
jgi:hypothetical protein